MIKNERLEREIADVVTAFGREEMALAAKSVAVNLRPRAIVVTLHEALPPAEQDYAAEAAGRVLLRRLYAAAFDAVKKSLEMAVSRKVGRPVRRSQLRVAKSGDSVFLFALGARSGRAGRRLRDRPP
jgi:uncharacterized protein YbcI